MLVVLSVGLLLIGAYEGEGAAIAGVVVEMVLLLALAGFLRAAQRDVLPSLRFLWRPLLALAAGVATLLVPLPEVVDAAVALGAFVLVALATRAVPAEVLLALRGRAPGDAERRQAESRPASWTRRYPVGAAAVGAAAPTSFDVVVPRHRAESLLP